MRSMGRPATICARALSIERVPHITLKSIANNSRIDDIWEKWQAVLEPLRAALNAALGRTPAVIPGRGDAASPEPMNSAGSQSAPANVPGTPPPVFTGSGPRASRRPGMTDLNGAEWQEWEIPREADARWPEKSLADHAAWWQARIARQQEIDAAIAQAAEVEKLYDRPYADSSRVRVAGPFTVESLSPH